jgi:hypothetical protein
VEGLGLAITLVGGAAGLIRPLPPASRAARVGVPPILLAFVLASACWGLYSAYLAIDLGLGALPLGPLLEAPLTTTAPWNRLLTGLLVAALATLCLVGGCEVRERVVTLPGISSGRSAELAWLVVLASAAVLALVPLGTRAMLLAGLGLAASALTGPRLARAARGGSVAGTAAGAVAFVAVALSAAQLPGWAAVLGAYPALTAVPVAVLATRLARAAR